MADPAAYAERLLSGQSPAAGREILSESSRALERVLLKIALEKESRSRILHPTAAARYKDWLRVGLSMQPQQHRVLSF